ncbi:membrane protein insertase YidC, partial [Brevundimonas denitrificans]
FLIIFGFQYFVETPQIEEQQTAEQTSAEGSAPKPGQAPGDASAPSAGMSAAGAMTREESLSKAPRIKINTPSLHGSVSLKGARIDDLTLINYREEVDPESPEVKLLSPAGSPAPYYAEFGWSVASGQSVNLPNSDTVWSTENDEFTPSKPLVLTWDNGEGLRFVRTYTLDENFLFTVEQKVENTTAADVTLYPYGLISRTGKPETTDFYILHEGPIGVLNATLEEIDYGDLVDDGGQNFTSTGGWMGITDKFWLTALLPDQTVQFKGRYNYVATADRYQTDYLDTAGVVIPAGGSAEATNRLFAGAKEVDVLDAYEEKYGIDRLELAIDWGWFYFLTKPIYFALDFLDKLIGNMGLAIL